MEKHAVLGGQISRRGVLRAFGIGVAGVSGIGLLSACGGGSGAAAGAGAGATLAVGQAVQIENLLAHTFNPANWDFHRALWDALVIMDGEPRPHLASEWTISPDGLVYEFTIRTGVTFHDGKPLTPQMVVDNLRFVADPKNLASGSTFMAGTDIAAEGDTVRLAFPTPTPQALTLLASFPIMDLTADLATKPNGTGPYKLDRFVPNSVVSMVANQNYWDQARKPAAGRYEVRVYTDQASMLSALSSRQIQAAQTPPVLQLTTLEQQGLRLVEAPSPGHYLFRCNAKDAVLGDKRVRQALSYAADRATFASLARSPLVVPAGNIFTKTSMGHVPELDQNVAQDLGRARQLLADAGHANGLTLSFLLSSARQPEHAAYVPVFQETLKSIGVTLKVEEVTPTVSTERLGKGDFQIQGDWHAWGNVDPALLFVSRQFMPKLNLSGFVEPEYEQRIVAAQSELDAEKRKGLYQDLNRYMVDQAFVIPLATRPLVYAVNDRVSTLVVDDLAMVDPAGTTLPV